MEDEMRDFLLAGLVEDHVEVATVQGCVERRWGGRCDAVVQLLEYHQRIPDVG